MTCRWVLVGGLVLSALGASPAVGASDEVAQPCGSAGLSLKKEQARGSTLALLSRVDAGGAATPEFRVERSMGEGAPEGGVVRLGCDPRVPVGQVLGMVRRRNGDWLRVEHPDEGVNVGRVLEAIGFRPALSTEPAVAVVTGYFGDSGLATLDPAGRAVAFGDRPSARPFAIAACPGGRVVVTVGAGGPGYPDYDYEFAAYDVEGLRLRRSVAIRPSGIGEAGLRCAHPDGEVAYMWGGGDRNGASKLTTFTGSTFRETPIPLADLSGAVAVPGGFLVPRPEGPC